MKSTSQAEFKGKEFLKVTRAPAVASAASCMATET